MKKSKQALTALALFASVYSAAHAKETAQVLPKNIYRIRAVGITTGAVKETFDSDGQRTSITSALNAKNSTQDLKNKLPPADKARMEQLTQMLNVFAPGTSENLVSLETRSEFSVTNKVLLPAIEYGISDKFSIGIRMPIITRNVRHKFTTGLTDNSDVALRKLDDKLNDPATPAVQKPVINATKNGLIQARSQIQAQTSQEAIEKKLFTDRGYELPRDFDSTDPGDLEAGFKYNFYKDEVFTSTMLFGVRAPTGKKASLTNRFDAGTSKEAWANGLQMLQEVYMGNGFTLGGAVKGVYNYADTRERAVPRDEFDAMPSLRPEDGQVEMVRRQRGPELETEMSLGYKFPGDVVGLWTAYQFNAKGKDKYYRGNRDLDYGALGKNTDQAYSAGEVGVEFSTIPWFRRKKAPVPMEVSLLYNHAFNGKNTAVAPYYRIDTIFYF